MPNFRCDFDVSGDLVLPNNTNALNLDTLGGFRMKIANQPLDTEGHAPGLSVSIVGPANSIETAHHELRAALASELDLLSYVTHSRFKIDKARLVVEWEDGQKTRHFIAFHTSDGRYPPDPELVSEYFQTTAAIEALKLPDFVGMAFRYFRHALGDERLEDQFISFWMALEIVAENVKEKSRVSVTCPRCEIPLRCSACQLELTRVPMASQAIKDLIYRVTGPEGPSVSERLAKARNGLIHGRARHIVERECKSPLDEIIDEIGAVTWHAIMLAIPLPDGPPLALGHRSGQFASLSHVMSVKGMFEHRGDAPHPSEELLSGLITITLRTNFHQDQNGGPA